jgi:hypothetical protein
MDKRNKTMSNGSKPMPEPTRPAPVQAQNTELSRRLFGKLTEAERRETEFQKDKAELAMLPDRIKNLAKELANTPFRRWTPEQMNEGQKYFTPEDLSRLARASEQNSGL